MNLKTPFHVLPAYSTPSYFFHDIQIENLNIQSKVQDLKAQDFNLAQKQFKLFAARLVHLLVCFEFLNFRHTY